MNYKYVLMMVFATQLLQAMVDKKDAVERKQTKREQREKEFSCNRCPSDDENDFEDQVELTSHQREIHGARIDVESLKRRKRKPLLFCKVCKKSVEYAREKEELNFHLERDHNFCVICDKECPEGIKLFGHKELVHPEEIKPIIEE